MEKAFSSVRDSGGLCIIADNLPQGKRLNIDPFELIRGKRIVGTRGGESDPDCDIPRYIEMYRSGKLNLEALISREYPLCEINQAFDDLEGGGSLAPLSA